MATERIRFNLLQWYGIAAFIPGPGETLPEAEGKVYEDFGNAIEAAIIRIRARLGTHGCNVHIDTGVDEVLIEFPIPDAIREGVKYAIETWRISLHGSSSIDEIAAQELREAQAQA